MLATAFLASLLVLPAATRGILSDLSFVVFPAIAAVSCLCSGAAAVNEGRRTWRLMGLAMSVWAAGGLVWCLYSFTGTQTPFPSFADVGFLGYAVPVCVALLLLPMPRPSGLLRVECALDASVVAASVTFCVALLVVVPVQAAGGDGILSRLFLLSYPFVDGLALALVLTTIMRLRSVQLRAWGTLLLGLLVLTVSNLLYVSLVARGTYETAAPYNVLWAVAFLLIAAAPGAGGLGSGVSRPFGVGRALLPHVAIVAVVLLSIGNAALLTSSSGLLAVALGFLVLVLSVAREVVAAFAKTQIGRELEREVTQATTGLVRQQAFLNALVDSLHVGVVACDRSGRLTFHNRSLAVMHGDPDAARSSQWAQDLRTADGSESLTREEVPLYRALAGETVEDEEIMVVPPDAPGSACAVNGRALRDETGAVIGAVVAMHDITERRRQQEALRQRALHDPLTGLGNRAAFTEHLQRQLDHEHPVGVVLLDLDDFKHINDSLGHDIGDQYLVLIAGWMVAALRQGCRAFRLGGDEFVIVVDVDLTTPIDLAHSVQEAISVPTSLAGSDVRASVSIGVAVSGPCHRSVSDLLKAADLAMYEAKAAGKGRVHEYEEHLGDAARDRLALENDLRGAIGSHQITLAYQPIVELATGRMRAAEALVRWNHPQHGPIGPDTFIPVAEQSGLIQPLGAWVLRAATAQLRAWDACGGDPDFRVTVNLSTRQLESCGLLDVLDECLGGGVHPSRIVLEVTETALTLDRAAAMDTMRAIRARGVSLAVDDFGTGYSSLSRLRDAPVSSLKIDRSFVSEIDSATAHAPIVVATLAMARGLGMGVVAEGVETMQQLQYLCRSSCPDVQGYLLSRPLAAEALLSCMSNPPWMRLMPYLPSAPDPRHPFQRLVELAVDPEVTLDQLVRPLLAELAAATGLTTTYLTRVDTVADDQEVQFVENPDATGVKEGLHVEWSQSLCRLALEEGPRHSSDTATAFPESEVVKDLSLASFIVERVSRPDGQLYGTLCGASAKFTALDDATSATVRRYAWLIEQKIHATQTPSAEVADPGTTTPQQQRDAAEQTWHHLRLALGQSSPLGTSAPRSRDSVDHAWAAQTELVKNRAPLPDGVRRVVVADDCLVTRQMLALLVSTPDLYLAGEAESAWAAVGVVAAEQPDILVLDYELGDANSDEVIDLIRKLSPGTRVLLHSSRADLHQLGSHMQVDDVIAKGAHPKEFRAALGRLAS